MYTSVNPFKKMARHGAGRHQDPVLQHRLGHIGKSVGRVWQDEASPSCRDLLGGPDTMADLRVVGSNLRAWTTLLTLVPQLQPLRWLAHKVADSPGRVLCSPGQPTSQSQCTTEAQPCMGLHFDVAKRRGPLCTQHHPECENLRATLQIHL